MPPKINATVTLSLWSLLSSGGEEWLNDLKPPLASAMRKNLLALGYIEEGKKKAPVLPGQKAQRARTCLTLTDKGWLYLQDHMEDELNSKSPAAAMVLGRLMAILSRFMGANQLYLAKVLGQPHPKYQPQYQPQAQEGSSCQPGPGKAPLEPQRLLSAIKSLDPALFMPGGGLMLSELRKAFPQYGPLPLEDALLALQEGKALVLCPTSDPASLSPADKEAAMLVAGSARHYLILN
jgi:hypothetical protein